MRYKILFIFLLLKNLVFSQKQIIYSDADRLLLVKGSSMSIFEDKTGNLKVKDVLNSTDFTTTPQSVPNLGVSKSSFWLKFEVKYLSGSNDLLILLAYPNLDKVEAFIITDTIIAEKMGKDRPFHERKYNSPGYIFDLKIKKNEVATILLKINSGGQIMAPVYIGHKEAVFDTVRSENLFIGIYGGVMLIMFFYNLFIYFIVEDKVYIYYVTYILAVGLVQICLLGYTFQFLWPDSTWLAYHSVYLLSPISCIAIIEFIKVFLRTKEFTPKLHKGFYFFTIFYSLYIVLDLFNYGDEAYNIIQLFAMLLSLYILFVAYRIMKMKYRPATFLFYAWIVFLIGVFVYALKDVGVLPYNSYTVFTMPVGSAIETALLSFALADKINAFRKEKEEANERSLKLLKENERIILNQKTLLETKVAERTAELEATNKSLKEAEAHLVNVEKMASLGQLTAGISHEINNPINFVISNVKPLKRDVGDILSVLNKYSDIKNEVGLDNKIKVIDALKKELDLDYLKEEIDQLLKGIEEGALRTSEIVKGLKNFARTNDLEFNRCDLHNGIDSTLSILHNTITNGNIKIIKQYGNLPEVECYPGKLNQVFMNILNNAIHAVIARNYKNGEGKVYIETIPLKSEVQIRIKDNGIGIPKQNFNKIFEPFFTTKEVGAGTGLGLSIVYGIINSHNGKIEIESEENEGAEFIITLPVEPQRI